MHSFPKFPSTLHLAFAAVAEKKTQTLRVRKADETRTELNLTGAGDKQASAYMGGVSPPTQPTSNLLYEDLVSELSHSVFLSLPHDVFLS